MGRPTGAFGAQTLDGFSAICHLRLESAGFDQALRTIPLGAVVDNRVMAHSSTARGEVGSPLHQGSGRRSPGPCPAQGGGVTSWWRGRTPSRESWMVARLESANIRDTLRLWVFFHAQIEADFLHARSGTNRSCARNHAVEPKIKFIFL